MTAAGSVALTHRLHPNTDDSRFGPPQADDFPVYRASLKDLATEQIIWRETNLHATASGDAKAVSIVVPARLLKPQTYAVELSGVSPTGAAEVINSYPFRVALK